MFLVSENYGNFYESSHTWIVGYTESLEEAELKKKELEDSYSRFQEFAKLDDALYDEIVLEGTDEEQELYAVASTQLLESMGFSNIGTHCYYYDYYNVSIIEVNKL